MIKRSNFLMILLLLLLVVVVGAFYYYFSGKEGDKEVIKIGAILPLTGDYADYGKNIQNGLILGMKSFNKTNDSILSIVFVDSKSKTRESVTAYQKLKLQGIRAILGPFSSSDVLSIAPIAEKEEVLLFTTSASSPRISEAGDYIFRNVPSDTLEITRLAKFAVTVMNLKNIAIIYNNSEYGIGVQQTFKKFTYHFGSSVPIIESYNSNTLDFRTQLTKIRQYNPDAILIVGYKEVAQVMKQAREIGIKAKFLTTALFEDPAVIALAGNAAEGVCFSSIIFEPDSLKPHTIQFYNSYKSLYGKKPDGFAATAYDAVHILGLALAQANGDIRKAKTNLYQMKPYKGLIGSYSFDNKGDIILPIKFKTIKEGRIQNI